MGTARIEGMDLVMDLIEGSERLNWMKTKIPEVVAMILGIADSLIWEVVPDSERGFQRDVANTIVCRWVLRVDQGEIIVDCWIDSREPRLAYATNMSSVRMDDIETVFHALEDFAKGMREWFPVLSNRWQPIRMAAINARKGE
ncbi:MAG: hypothetical protein A2365_01530 [Candidatus Nealsonbacteria bacterium RIFOXYB1_FULL_40_15]|uniref:Uncharacterized protein n=2 Tax=Candidatus Nealsoniibacteriota TaxID=1817911 RepID=A0A1G2ENX3_9BACT|nr:MAG: hypothetical protein A2427_00070 [Candidatus Nealsonbacteria bacterium RIFOXYC1_FULL_40_7]OGZ27253.1 MAG: hypothetical protein A2365_01530 [Candidatus Nealsonbacteria bacterium RIFOXYB1_FULL_40_15]OGZ29290.1 MAG: hypothetical protein A2562_02760 [Candidatus Nealsonbacteria bacterium RIFOXYD1_FULL_39_11]